MSVPPCSIQTGANDVELPPKTCPPEELATPVLTQPEESPILTKEDKPKDYCILDLFWVLNPKLKSREPLDDGEAQAAIIQYNINFGNLRISLHNIPQGALQKNVIYRMLLENLTVGTIYPSSVFKIIHAKTGENFTCLEQLLYYTGEDWQKNRPVCKIYKSDTNVRFEVFATDVNKTFFYNFQDWQKDLFMYSCEYVITHGLTLTGHKKMVIGKY